MHSRYFFLLLSKPHIAMPHFKILISPSIFPVNGVSFSSRTISAHWPDSLQTGPCIYFIGFDISGIGFSICFLVFTQALGCIRYARFTGRRWMRFFFLQFIWFLQFHIYLVSGSRWIGCRSAWHELAFFSFFLFFFQLNVGDFDLIMNILSALSCLNCNLHRKLIAFLNPSYFLFIIERGTSNTDLMADRYRCLYFFISLPCLCVRWVSRPTWLPIIFTSRLTFYFFSCLAPKLKWTFWWVSFIRGIVFIVLSINLFIHLFYKVRWFCANWPFP